MRHYPYSAVLGALNDVLRVPVANMTGARVDIRGTFVASFAVEATMDGGNNWVTLAMAAGGNITLATGQFLVTTTPGNFVIGDVAGFQEVRVRCSAFTSGSATINLTVTEENQVDQVGLIGSPTVTLGAGAALVGQVFNADNMFWNESFAAQAAAATVTGATRDAGVAVAIAHRYAKFNAFAFADQAGTMRIEVSVDNVTWRRATIDTAVAANTPVLLTIPVFSRYHRAVFINGATLQTAFMLNTSFTAS